MTDSSACSLGGYGQAITALQGLSRLPLFGLERGQIYLALSRGHFFMAAKKGKTATFYLVKE
jgi:hypothetical protein